jgi:hypothetical protein
LWQTRHKVVVRYTVPSGILAVVRINCTLSREMPNL